MKVFVTGATGYIGARVCAKLIEQGHEVHALVRKQSNTSRLHQSVQTHEVSGDNLAAIMQSVRPDVIFHLASYVTPAADVQAAQQIIRDNIDFGVAVLAAAVQAGCKKFISTGTYWSYGFDGQYAPNTLYAASKKAFADILQWYAKAHKFSAANLILFDVYGDNDWRGKLLPFLVQNLGNTNALELTGGAQLLDMVHVDDVAEAFIHAVDCLPEAGTVPEWGVATGRQVSLRAVVSELERISGKKLAATWGAKPYPDYQIMEPVTQAALPNVPNWSAQISLEQGLAQLVHVSQEFAESA